LLCLCPETSCTAVVPAGRSRSDFTTSAGKDRIRRATNHVQLQEIARRLPVPDAGVRRCQLALHLSFAGAAPPVAPTWQVTLPTKSHHDRNSSRRYALPLAYRTTHTNRPKLN